MEPNVPQDNRPIEAEAGYLEVWLQRHRLQLILLSLVLLGFVGLLYFARAKFEPLTRHFSYEDGELRVSHPLTDRSQLDQLYQEFFSDIESKEIETDFVYDWSWRHHRLLLLMGGGDGRAIDEGCREIDLSQMMFICTDRIYVGYVLLPAIADFVDTNIHTAQTQIYGKPFTYHFRSVVSAAGSSVTQWLVELGERRYLLLQASEGQLEEDLLLRFLEPSQDM